MRLLVTGLPVRGELLKARKDISRKNSVYQTEKYLVLSFGGSLGAKPLNDAMFDILLESANNDNITIFIQSELTAVNFLKNSKKTVL